MNYEAIKTLAKELKVPVTSLIALSPQNDPFYAGTPRDKTLARWFAELWREFGYTTGVHIRRMHYAIVSQNPPVLLPNGEPYKNTVRCWDELNNASKAARYLEYVDPAAFVDRRNDEPLVYLDWYTERSAYINVEDVKDASEFELPAPSKAPRYEYRVTSPQRYHLEIWCEKSTMNDVLEPLVSRYRATLLYGKGELSITAALQAIKRFERSGKPVRIFYVSDFDPAGAGMPVSMSRKLEYFLNKLGLNLDIKLFPVVLTHQQTQEYTRLLPTPIKESERRREKFESRYQVDGAVELDALEALYPGELRRILIREMSRYYDNSLARRIEEAEREMARHLGRIQRRVHEDYQDRIDALESEWQTIASDFQERVRSHMEQRESVWQAIASDLNELRPDMDIEDIPIACEAIERDGALYDSTRDYIDQNAVYQAHKSNSDVA